MKNNKIKMTISQDEYQHQAHLTALREKLESNNITPASLRAMKNKTTEKRKVRSLTEQDMEDIILSLYEETEQQALTSEDLQQQLAESKAKMLVLQRQFQAIRAIVEGEAVALEA